MATNSEDTNISKSSRSNVRTGCIVCRIRKVKCDETKPHCVRCTSTGRKCEGYIEPPPIQKRARSPKYGYAPTSLSLYSPSTEPCEDINERRSFQYFRSRTLQHISSYFEAEFWGYFVLQVSRVEPAVRHALVALSSLYEAYELHSKDPPNASNSATDSPTRFALQQYTKAVGLLANDGTTDRPSLQAVLMSCVLFVWIEFIQGNLNIALNHLQGGLQILQDLQKSSTVTNIDPSLPRLFRRLHIQARLHGSPTSGFNNNLPEEHISSKEDVPEYFSTIIDARDSMDNLLDSIFQFLRRMYSFEFVRSTSEQYPFPHPKSLEATVQYHLQELQKWQTTYRRNTSLVTNPFDGKHSAGIILLELQCVTVNVMLKTLLETSEMVFDQYKADFEHIISLADRLIHCEQRSSRVVVSFDMGVIAPLFMVALKCRYLGMRRRAIALLKQAPDREGMWHRNTCVEFAERKVKMEERGRGSLPETEALPEMVRMHSERNRVAVVDGKRVSILRFKRGPADRVGENEFEEEISDLSEAMGELL